MNLPDSHFINSKEEKDFEDFDPDDEELLETPKDVIMLLGFDPKELEEL